MSHGEGELDQRRLACHQKPCAQLPPRPYHGPRSSLMHMFRNHTSSILPRVPACGATIRWPRAQGLVRVFCYISLSIFIATSACNPKRTPCGHESTPLDARIEPWPIDVYRIHYKNTSLASGDAARGSINEDSKRVGRICFCAVAGSKSRGYCTSFLN